MITKTIHADRKRHDLRRSASFQSLAAVLTAVLCACSTRVWAQQSLDTITNSRGIGEKGMIVQTSPTELTMSAAGKEKQYALDDVRDFYFGDEPAEMRRARGQIKDNQVELALEELERIDASTISRELVKEELEFLIAHTRGRIALSSGRELGTAVKSVRDFVTAHRNSAHYFACIDQLGQLAAASGRFDVAERFYDELGKVPWTAQKLRADVLRADARRLQGANKLAQAKELYDNVIGSREPGEEAELQRNLAIAGKAICEAQLGQPQAGIDAVQALIERNDPQNTHLFAHAYNALGACELAAGRKVDALLAYLHVHILFYQDRETHAEALYYIQQLFQDEGFADRAQQIRNLLKESYPSSYWAQK